PPDEQTRPRQIRARTGELDAELEARQPAGLADAGAQRVDAGEHRLLDRTDVEPAVTHEIEPAVLVEARRRVDLVVRDEADVGDAERRVDVDTAEDHAAQAEVTRDQLALLDVAEVIAEEPPRVLDLLVGIGGEHTPRLRGLERREPRVAL